MENTIVKTTGKKTN